MIGVIRRSSDGYRFESEGGWSYRLLVSGSFWRNPRHIDERQIIEALYTSDGSLMLYRILAVGYDLSPPLLIGFRMLLKIM